jgi:hypothetical protein
MSETRQFSRVSDRLITECISFGDKALDCDRCGKGQALVLVGILLADWLVGFLCRVAHERMLSRSLKFFSAPPLITEEILSSQPIQLSDSVVLEERPTLCATTRSCFFRLRHA